MHWELSRFTITAITAGDSVALRVHPGGDSQEVRHVGGEHTLEQNVIGENHIHFEHIGLKLLMDN